MSLEVTNKITVDWKIEGIKELLEKAKTEDVDLSSNPFDNGRWHLQLELAADGNEDVGVYLYARPQNEDRLLASSKETWTRAGQYTFSLTIYTNEYREMAGTHSAVKTFSQANRCWGWHKVCSVRDLTPPLWSQENTITVECEISTKKPTLQLQSQEDPYRKLVDMIVNSKDSSNVVFNIQPTMSSTASHIFALKEVLIARSPYFQDLFSSDFCESRLERLDPKSLAGRPAHAFVGDGDDFAPFESLLRGEAEAVVDEDHSPSQAAKVAFAAGYPRAAAKNDSTAEHRSYFRVTVRESSYATCLALVTFLYTGQISFLPPTSDYLIAFQDEPRNPPDAPYSVEARDDWLLNKALKKDPPPCNPHALYRLADRYLMDDLTQLAQGYIVRSLTVETAPYELFSQLSLDYDEHCDVIFEFVLEHWTAVKKTRAWRQAMQLLEDGQLPGGMAVLSKIHEALEA